MDIVNFWEEHEGEAASVERVINLVGLGTVKGVAAAARLASATQLPNGRELQTRLLGAWVDRVKGIADGGGTVSPEDAEVLAEALDLIRSIPVPGDPRDFGEELSDFHRQTDRPR